jgi:hypothetical protein
LLVAEVVNLRNVKCHLSTLSVRLPRGPAMSYFFKRTTCSRTQAPS